jgi:hypothetical protein
MAFLCKDCIHPDYRQEFFYRPISHGPCENCHYTDSCVDTKSPTDPKWHEYDDGSIDFYCAGGKDVEVYKTSDGQIVLTSADDDNNTVSVRLDAEQVAKLVGWLTP